MSERKYANVCRKLFSCLLAVTILVLSFSFPTFAKGTGQAMKISKVEGVVATQTADLKNKAAVNNMVLDDAVRVACGEKSYCWIKLDNNKLVKLDSLSDVTIVKTGKIFDVYLNSGNLFFNITKKLKADEKLRFHSGGTISNVTGTSGFISIDENGKTTVTILEGKTEVSYPKPNLSISSQAAAATSNTANSATVSVSGGYAVSVSATSLGSATPLTAVPINSTSVPGFVAVEIKNDTSLQRKIQNANTLLDVASISNNANTLLVVNETAKAQSIEIKRQEKIEIARREQEEREKREREKSTNREADRGSHSHSFEHIYTKDIDKIVQGASYSWEEYKDYDVFVWTKCTGCNGEFQHAIKINTVNIEGGPAIEMGNVSDISELIGTIEENHGDGKSITAQAFCKACNTNVTINYETLVEILNIIKPATLE